jgi:branched-chain amino acid transport system substrate-binding protein
LRDAKPDAVFAFVGAQNGGVPFMRAFDQSGLGRAGMRVIATGDLTVEANFPGLGDAVAGVISASNYSAVPTRRPIAISSASTKSNPEATSPTSSPSPRTMR